MKKKGAPSGSSSAQDKPILALTGGDPCGVGPEILLKAVADERAVAAARLVAVGDAKRMRQTAKELKIKWPFASVTAEMPEGKRWCKPQLLDLGNVDESLLVGQISAGAGKASAEMIEKAVALAAAGRVQGIVTAPIHKEALSLAGYADPGHTEMLQRLTGARKVGMLFWTPEMSVGLLTTHMSLKDAIRKVRCSKILDKLELFHREWERLFGSRPHIAVAGLNPHAGEGGRFGTEEIQEILPAIEKARDKGLRVDGPVPADTVFARCREGAFDLVLSLYHDQATIPIKLVSRQQSVNVTIGLPFIRTSVDHGTAMDIAGKGVASPESMVQAILLAARLALLPTAE